MKQITCNYFTHIEFDEFVRKRFPKLLYNFIDDTDCFSSLILRIKKNDLKKWDETKKLAWNNEILGEIGDEFVTGMILEFLVGKEELSEGIYLIEVHF